MNEITEDTTYEQFLDTWEGTRHLEHATLDAYLFDPLAEHRLFADVAVSSEVPRYIKTPGSYNGMSAVEQALRHMQFFREQQPLWAREFRERLLDDSVRSDRVDAFLTAMSSLWVDGSNRRQGAPEMQALKASIGWHDRKYAARYAGKFVIRPFDETIEPLFEPREIAKIFEVNSNMLENHMASYLTQLYGEREGSINQLYVRRGVCMPGKPKQFLEELHYLNSYSLASGPVELFAQTQGRKQCCGMPCIFSAPIPAVQQRVVAFAPFIVDMQLDQLEFVVAPPVRPTPVRHQGDYGDPPASIGEYEFN